MCKAHGHWDAETYPLGRLYDEAALIEERANGELITANELLKLAVYSVFTKKARKELEKSIKKLNTSTGVNPKLFL